jgi:hypothetical protein
MIIQVEQTDDKKLGGQIRNRTHGQPIYGTDFQSGMLSDIETEKNPSGIVQSLLGNLISKITKKSVFLIIFANPL